MVLWKSKDYHILSDCAFVAFGTQRELGMRQIFIRSLPGSTISFRIIS